MSGTRLGRNGGRRNVNMTHAALATLINDSVATALSTHVLDQGGTSTSIEFIE